MGIDVIFVNIYRNKEYIGHYIKKLKKNISWLMLNEQLIIDLKMTKNNEDSPIR